MQKNWRSIPYVCSQIHLVVGDAYAGQLNKDAEKLLAASRQVPPVNSLTYKLPTAALFPPNAKNVDTEWVRYMIVHALSDLKVEMQRAGHLQFHAQLKPDVDGVWSLTTTDTKLLLSHMEEVGRKASQLARNNLDASRANHWPI